MQVFAHPVIRNIKPLAVAGGTLSGKGQQVADNGSGPIPFKPGS